jgi:hypothetical protein
LNGFDVKNCAILHAISWRRTSHDRQPASYCGQLALYMDPSSMVFILHVALSETRQMALMK